MSKMIPSAVIHCTNKEELTKTLTELEELKFRWNGMARSLQRLSWKLLYLSIHM